MYPWENEYKTTAFKLEKKLPFSRWDFQPSV